MATMIATDILCDWCSNWVEGTNDKSESVQKARREAKANGWRFRWSRKRQQFEDVCPTCQIKHPEKMEK